VGYHAPFLRDLVDLCDQISGKTGIQFTQMQPTATAIDGMYPGAVPDTTMMA